MGSSELIRQSPNIEATEVAQIKELIKRCLPDLDKNLELENGYSQEIVLIVLLILFKFHNNLDQPAAITEDDIQQLLLIIQAPSDLELQLLYINWLYPKIANGTASTLFSKGAESNSLTAALFQAVGGFTHLNLAAINGSFTKGTLELSDLPEPFSLLTHMQEALKFDFTPSHNSVGIANRLRELRRLIGLNVIKKIPESI